MANRSPSTSRVNSADPALASVPRYAAGTAGELSPSPLGPVSTKAGTHDRAGACPSHRRPVRGACVTDRWRRGLWMSVLTDIRNRGVKDVFFVVCDGLKGLPEVVANVWPLTIVQTCIIHLIRNTFHLASKRDWDALKRDVKPICTAVNAAAARAALDQLLCDPHEQPGVALTG